MASREGFDVRNKYGRWNLWRYLKRYKSLPKAFWIDSFMPTICFVIGHVAYRSDGDDLACKRCWHYIDDGKEAGK